MKNKVLFGALLASLLLVGCTNNDKNKEQENEGGNKEEETIVKVSSVTISGEATVEEGQELQLTASVTPDNATDKTLTWSSSNEEVATVDANGKVTAIKAGSVTITATSSEATVKAEKEITVTAKVVEAQVFATIDGTEKFFSGYKTPSAPVTFETKDETPVTITVDRKSALTQTPILVEGGEKENVLCLMAAPGSGSTTDKVETYFEFDFGEEVIKKVDFQMSAYFNHWVDKDDPTLTGTSSDKEHLNEYLDSVNIQQWNGTEWVDAKVILEADIPAMELTDFTVDVDTSKIRFYAAKKESTYDKNVGRVIFDNIKFSK